ncbi:putative disease resistance protein [Dorcoceras hygrometricum]|uniref:Putative disease resistance protein n=1 Tax=Dorcoceras hygrometricum TaxID=472368 RepID=A0A2Z7CKV0_9LAMI|nr:putative disease resistance protein [Dorcoceras hygrometricum]
MGITDFFAGEIVAELLKQLIAISRKSVTCRSSALRLIEYIEGLLPIIQEIKFSGVELPQHRQRGLDNFSQILSNGLQLASKVLKSSRWNMYQQFHLARKMEKFERTVSKFMEGLAPAHVLADVHHVRVGMDVGFDRLERQLDAIKIGVDTNDGRFGAALRRVEEEEERWWECNFGGICGAGLELGKRKLKDMLLAGNECFRVIGIHGIGGSGKTTLAREICRDDQIRSYFKDMVFFLTVSQSPNVEELRRTICSLISGFNIMGCREIIPQEKLQLDYENPVPSLVVLDDVWSQSVLEQLIIKIPGCKYLVVSRSKFPPSIVQYSYELDLLSENEAMSLFCYSAFGQTCIPHSADKQLVEQIVDECKRLPLALKVIGASLNGQSEMFWISARNRLSRSQPFCESHEVQLLERMKISIDFLSKPARECFLDLGAFPEDKKIPLDILVNMWVELHNIEEDDVFSILVELSDKNLLTLVKDARAGEKYSTYYEISVCQHDVLRDLVIHLSNLDCVNKRRRLLMPRRGEGLPKEWERNIDEPFNAHLISAHTGEMREMDWLRIQCPKTEVLILNFSSNVYFLPAFLENMPRLKALILINYSTSTAILHNTSVFSTLTNLRSLWIEKILVSYPLLPDTTIPLSNLKKMSLILCDMSNAFDRSTVELPHLFPNLSELTMDHCINMIRLPSSIGRMHTLKSLSVTNCDGLQELPFDLGELKLLQILRLHACPNLRRLPSVSGNFVSLKCLDISQCVNMEGLPEGMGGCTGMEKIDMSGCPKMKNLPTSLAGLRSLRRVVCDEDVSWLWKQMEKIVFGLIVHVPEECFTLDWLME